jgi:imidazole glycerol-phosphate synthase subunit HisH
MITVMDYGLGNIRAFMNVYERLNVPCRTASSADELTDAVKIILPGVGSFDRAMDRLEASGMRGVLEQKVLQEKVPVIGICVGMQILADSSEEGTRPGLGWIPGAVRRFDAARIPYATKLPHMGWNTVRTGRPDPLMDSFNGSSRFYFLHSYYFECADASHMLSQTDYGLTYASAVQRGNIYGIQFHPEKSHSAGVTLLHNFARL